MTRGVALVTGATRRLGRVLALAAARAGHDLALHYRSDSGEAEETVAAVRALGRQAIALPCDLADAAALPGLLAAASALGPVTLLVNSAS
ncbi:MAG: SDR family NAD(P)-dependent oxidoreductase, partial [Caulobacteraceae bacterium]|nr:SDR family NAD(P)-dependent oxidoreductase [Caulobacteraceae bacterium]